METSDKVKKLRGQLKEFDDARYGWMMRQWAKISDSPQKAGYTALVIAATAFVLGWLVG